MTRNAPDSAFPIPWDIVRVPAEDVCHVYEPHFPGQVRGLSLFGPLGTRLVETDKLEDALLARFNTAALFGAYVSDPGGEAGFANGAGPVSELSMEPGTLRVLPTGSTITFSDVPDANGAGDFLRHMIRSIAAGGSIPYELISGDLSAGEL